MSERALAKEIFTARKEFEACLISSALLTVVVTKTGAAAAGHFSRCAGNLKFLSCLCGHGALFHNQFGAASLGGDHSRDIVNCTQVRISVFQRRSSHADED